METYASYVVEADNGNYDLAANHITVTPPVVTFSVSKKWMNADGSAADWPEGASVTVELLGNGQPLDKITPDVLGEGRSLDRMEVTLTSDKQEVTFRSIPVYDALTYSIAETAVTGVSKDFSSDVNGSLEDGFVVTNTFTGKEAESSTTTEIDTTTTTEAATTTTTEAATTTTTEAATTTTTEAATTTTTEAATTTTTEVTTTEITTETTTETDTGEHAELRVRKNLEFMISEDEDNESIFARNAVYYVTLFKDYECTEMVPGSTHEIVFDHSSQAYAAPYTNLEVGKTYYLAETDRSGNKIDSSGDVMPVMPSGEEVETIELTESGTMEIDFSNIYVEWPDGFYYEGHLNVVKKLLGTDGKPKNGIGSFYAGIFLDEDCTELAGTDIVSHPVVELDLNGKNTSDPFDVTVYLTDDEPAVDLYVTETDKNGRAKPDAIVSKYDISLDNEEITVDKDDSEVQTVVITNKEKSSAVATVTPTRKPTVTPAKTSYSSGSSGSTSYSASANVKSDATSHSEESKAKAANTADETPVNFYLMLLALSAIALITALRRRKENEN